MVVVVVLNLSLSRQTAVCICVSGLCGDTFSLSAVTWQLAPYNWMNDWMYRISHQHPSSVAKADNEFEWSESAAEYFSAAEHSSPLSVLSFFWLSTLILATSLMIGLRVQRVSERKWHWLCVCQKESRRSSRFLPTFRHLDQSWMPPFSFSLSSQLPTKKREMQWINSCWYPCTAFTTAAAAAITFIHSRWLCASFFFFILVSFNISPLIHTLFLPFYRPR